MIPTRPTRPTKDPQAPKAPKDPSYNLYISEEGYREDLPPRKRHPGDHDGWPTNEQMEYFKRGGR